jgi:uncharacterized protein (TIGR03435 family)
MRKALSKRFPHRLNSLPTGRNNCRQLGTISVADQRVINWQIENLISYAYGVDEYQIVGAPKWPWPTMFVIEAKGDSEADAKMAALTKEQQRAEQQHMVQALLEERFKLMSDCT